MKTKLELDVLDCSLQRKIKPFQNISLIIFCICWLLIFILLLFEKSTFNLIFNILFGLSIFSLLTFLFLSLFFLKQNKKGKIYINESFIIFNDIEYALNQCLLDLNLYSTDNINNLPFWGNYFILPNNNKIEFLPDKNLNLISEKINISNAKRSVLSMKTTDLFKSVMDILWAAS